MKVDSRVKPEYDQAANTLPAIGRWRAALRRAFAFCQPVIVLAGHDGERGFDAELVGRVHRPVWIVERFPGNRDRIGVPGLKDFFGMVGATATRFFKVRPRNSSGENSIGPDIFGRFLFVDGRARVHHATVAHRRGVTKFMTMNLSLGIRGQFPQGDDMSARLEELLDQVRLARKLGFVAVLKTCHFSSTPFQEIQQIPFLARIAGELGDMSIITGIVLLPLHKPLEVAEHMATLDLLSGGKLIFGAGLGYREVEFKAFGMTQRDRVRRFEENFEAIRRLWTEDTVTMKGSHFELDNATCSLKPLQKPHPPMWIGANADAAIERAARIADSWMINPHNRIDTIARQLGVYKRELDRVGKPMPAVLPMARELFVAESRDAAMRLAGPYIEAKYKAYKSWGQDKAMPEGDNDLGQDFDELADGRFIFGSVDEVAEQIIALAKATGFNQLNCPFQWPGMPQIQVLDQMHLMAEEVLPRVRQGL